MFKNEFIQQYGHTWRVFENLVQDFESEAWLQTGRGAVTPARLSLHILLAAQYYLEDLTPFAFPSGKQCESEWESKIADLPTQADIMAFSREMKERTEQWLSDLDLDAENKTFPWAGKTQLGVVLFLLRHSLFHIGELSSLLNESKAGHVKDHYVHAL